MQTGKSLDHRGLKKSHMDLAISFVLLIINTIQVRTQTLRFHWLLNVNVSLKSFLRKISNLCHWKWIIFKSSWWYWGKHQRNWYQSQLQWWIPSWLLSSIHWSNEKSNGRRRCCQSIYRVVTFGQFCMLISSQTVGKYSNQWRRHQLVNLTDEYFP